MLTAGALALLAGCRQMVQMARPRLASADTATAGQAGAHRQAQQEPQEQVAAALAQQMAAQTVEPVLSGRNTRQRLAALRVALAVAAVAARLPQRESVAQAVQAVAAVAVAMLAGAAATV